MLSTDEKLAYTQALTQSQVHCPGKHPLSCRARQNLQGNPPTEGKHPLYVELDRTLRVIPLLTNLKNYFEQRMR